MSEINKYVVEAVGTFFFLSVILHTLADNTLGPQSVAIALLAAIILEIVFLVHISIPQFLLQCF